MAMTILAYNMAPPLIMGKSLTIVLGFLALIGSFNVSYSAARAKSVGYKYKRPWAGRDVRLFIIMIAGIFAKIFSASLLLFLLILAVLTFSETILRIKKAFEKKSDFN